MKLNIIVNDLMSDKKNSKNMQKKNRKKNVFLLLDKTELFDRLFEKIVFYIRYEIYFVIQNCSFYLKVFSV